MTLNIDDINAEHMQYVLMSVCNTIEMLRKRGMFKNDSKDQAIDKVIMVIAGAALKIGGVDPKEIIKMHENGATEEEILAKFT